MELNKAENPEQYAKLANTGLLLGYPVKIGGEHARPDNGIHYHSSIKFFNPEVDHPHQVHEIAQHLPLNPPDAKNTQIGFDTFKDRFGHDVYVVKLHGNSAAKIKEHNAKFAHMGYPSTFEWQPHISVDKATWDKLKSSGAKTAHEAGIEFGQAELKRGPQTLKTYRHEADTTEPKVPDLGDMNAKLDVNKDENDLQKTQPTYVARNLKGIPTGKEPGKGPAFTSIPSRPEQNVQEVGTKRQREIAALSTANAQNKTIHPDWSQDKRPGVVRKMGTHFGDTIPGPKHGISFPRHRNTSAGRTPQEAVNAASTQHAKSAINMGRTKVPTEAYKKKMAAWEAGKPETNQKIRDYNKKHLELQEKIRNGRTPQERDDARTELALHQKNGESIGHARKPREQLEPVTSKQDLKDEGLAIEDVKAHEAFHDTMKNIEAHYGEDISKKIKNSMLKFFDPDSINALAYEVLNMKRNGEQVYHRDDPHFDEELLNYARQASTRAGWKNKLKNTYGEEGAKKHINNLKNGVKKAANYIRHLQNSHIKAMKEPETVPLAASEKNSEMLPLMKPYVSEAQRRWAHTPTGKKALGGDAGVHEWDEATKGKKLPERVSKSEKDPGKEGYTFKHRVNAGSEHGPTDAQVSAYHNGKMVGGLRYGVGQNEPEHLIAMDVHVKPEHRRKGLATAMYRHAEKEHGKSFRGNMIRTDAGQALWDQKDRPFGKSEIDKKSTISLNKSVLRNAGIALGMAGALAGGQAGAVSPTKSQVPHRVAVPQNTYNHKKMLDAIAQAESSGGKNINHKAAGGPIHGSERAYGRWGLMPETIRETINAHKDLKAKHAKALALKGDLLHRYMQDHKGLEETIADRHLSHMEHVLGPNVGSLAHSWLNGISGTLKAKKNGVDVGNHWYSKKIRDLYGKE